MSGPLILSASSYYQTAAEKLEKEEKQAGKTGKTAENMGREAPALLKLDLKPALSAEQLDKRILRDFEDNKNKQFKNAVDGLFPGPACSSDDSAFRYQPGKKVHEITREERKFFIECIKGLTLTVTGTRGFEEAIITRGGIKVKEVNPSTMESKLVSGLYLAGEMLDLDALTGGFNLQIAWSTGHLAGAEYPPDKLKGASAVLRQSAGTGAEMSYNIAIDGPAGAGKSTSAKQLAKKLGYVYVDTGAMYRAIALYLLREKVKPDDTEAVSNTCTGAEVTLIYQNGEQAVLFERENVNGFIRTEEVGNMASRASAVPAVRERLLQLQRDLASSENVIMDGRDIGTCVLPNADVKIFLTANSAVRAKRRYEELLAKGNAGSA